MSLFPHPPAIPFYSNTSPFLLLSLSLYQTSIFNNTIFSRGFRHRSVVFVFCFYLCNSKGLYSIEAFLQWDWASSWFCCFFCHWLLFALMQWQGGPSSSLVQMVIRRGARMRHLKQSTLTTSPRDSIFAQSTALTLRSTTTVGSKRSEWFPLVLIPYTTSRMKSLLYS